MHALQVTPLTVWAGPPVLIRMPAAVRVALAVLDTSDSFVALSTAVTR